MIENQYDINNPSGALFSLPFLYIFFFFCNKSEAEKRLVSPSFIGETGLGAEYSLCFLNHSFPWLVIQRKRKV